MRVDALALRLRPRTPLEAADLGTRLCGASAASVYSCYTVAALPILTLALASYDAVPWLPALLIWWLKPWLDRTILFVLSRAAFGQATSPSDLWREQRSVLWQSVLTTLTVRRLSLWRPLTQPVYQLEGFSLPSGGSRVRQIRRRTVAAGLMVTAAFSAAEAALTISGISLVFWLAPAGQTPKLVDVLAGQLPNVFSLTVPIAYALSVLFLEPFYVAAGFAMYLNRRVDLEAWDIEQEFRRAFAA